MLARPKFGFDHKVIETVAAFVIERSDFVHPIERIGTVVCVAKQHGVRRPANQLASREWSQKRSAQHEGSKIQIASAAR